jgi:hypothetical protein
MFGKLTSGGRVSSWRDIDTDSYRFRDLCSEILSPGALGTMEQLREEILVIYDLPELLETRLPGPDRTIHADKLRTRLQRVVKLLPQGVSPMPNEVFTAIEFLVYEIHERPIRIGEAIVRLELLADEIRGRPLLHDLLTGRAN